GRDGGGGGARRRGGRRRRRRGRRGRGGRRHRRSGRGRGRGQRRRPGGQPLHALLGRHHRRAHGDAVLGVVVDRDRPAQRRRDHLPHQRDPRRPADQQHLRHLVRGDRRRPQGPFQGG